MPNLWCVLMLSLSSIMTRHRSWWDMICFWWGIYNIVVLKLFFLEKISSACMIVFLLSIEGWVKDSQLLNFQSRAQKLHFCKKKLCMKGCSRKWSLSSKLPYYYLFWTTGGLSHLHLSVLTIISVALKAWIRMH